jgi:hypothetical protein
MDGPLASRTNANPKRSTTTAAPLPSQIQKRLLFRDAATKILPSMKKAVAFSDTCERFTQGIAKIRRWQRNTVTHL